MRNTNLNALFTSPVFTCVYTCSVTDFDRATRVDANPNSSHLFLCALARNQYVVIVPKFTSFDYSSQANYTNTPSGKKNIVNECWKSHMSACTRLLFQPHGARPSG